MSRYTASALASASVLWLFGAVAYAHDKGDHASRDAKQCISDYQSQAADLDNQPANAKHPAEVRAMRSLASALEALPSACSDCDAAGHAIRRDARRIDESHARSRVHTRLAKDALTQAVAALESLKDAAKDVRALPDKLADARSTIDQIDPNVAFLKQRDTIDSAFQKVGDALELVGQSPAVAGVLPQEERQNVVGQEVTAPPPVETPAPAPQPPTTIIENQPAPPPSTTVVEQPPPAPVVVYPRHEDWYKQIAVEAGGGYASFGAKGLRDITQNGGEWDFRLVLGARSPFAVELGYVGTANQLNGRMTGVDPNTVILSDAFEGDLRLSTPAWHRMPVQVFGFAGAGYNRFDLTNSSFNNGQLTGRDDTFVLPAGGGLQINFSNNLVLDGRFTYRAIFDENLMGRDHNADMYTATGRIGYVF